MQAMNIARVNSIFPNDVMVLMPASRYNKLRGTSKLKKERANIMVQTEDIIFSKLQNLCKEENNAR
jgi:hypothetical protein